MIAIKNYLDSKSRTLAWAQPFNEPDYGWNQGTQQNLHDIINILMGDSTYNSVGLAGAACLNANNAAAWYNAIKYQARGVIGTTHCISGSLTSYANFWTLVASTNGVSYAPELHNLCEAIAGAEYGMGGGCWWLRADLARGSFVKACQGVRLGYAEDRTKWTAAAVYRAPSGAVQAFVGSAELEGQATTYRFMAKDRDVFYDGDGPRRDFNVSWTTNQEKVINITWGADVPPAPISGRYIVANRNSGKVMEVVTSGTYDGANIQQNTYTGGANQQWDIYPYVTGALDQSYFTVSPVHSGKYAEVSRSWPDYAYNAGDNLQQWTGNGGEQQQWFFEYAGNNYYYIRNRWSGLYLEVAGASTANGGNIQQFSYWTPSPIHQQWRLIPVGAAVEFVAPVAPTGLAATPNPASVNLTWNANTESDLASYTIFRSGTSGGTYDTIGRGITTNSFTDKSANQNKTYYYVVKAVDKSLNQSAYSAQVSAKPAGSAALVAKYGFDSNANDSSGNANHAVFTGAATYGAGRIGAGAVVLNGTSNYLSLPSTVANYDQITIASWVYWNGGTAFQRIFDFGNDTTQYMFLTPNSGSGMRFAINNTGTEQQVNASVLPTGKWVHVAVTLGNGTAQLYVGGTNVASSSVTIKPTDFTPVINYIGKSQFSADALFNGKVDDLQIYNYALSSTQVAALANQTPAALTDPIAYLKFDETTGTTASDVTGNGWNATLINSPTWVSGTLNNAVNLTSTASQYLALPAGIVNGLTDFTLSTWVNPTSLTTWARAFDFGTSTTLTGTTGAYMFLAPSNGSAVRFSITNSGYANEQGITGTAPLATGSWSHVAVSLSGSTGKLYVNGKLVGTNSAMTLNPSSLGVTTLNYLGRSQFSADPYLNGSLDDFRIYARAISDSEAVALASGTLSAPTGFTTTPGPNQIQLSWNSAANAESYTIKYATTSGGPYTTVASGLMTPSYTHSNLTYGTTYYYVVTASNITGTSPNSSQISATPGSPLINQTERNSVQITPAINANGSSGGSVTIPSSVVGHSYQVQSTNDLINQPWTNIGNPQPGTGSDLKITLPSVPPSKRAFYRVVIMR